MTIGSIRVFSPLIKSDNVDISFNKEKWELAKSDLDNGEDFWDYPIDDINYLCNPDNGHCGEEFLLIDGRLHKLKGMSFLTEFYIITNDDIEPPESNIFGSLADALNWCKSKVATDVAEECRIYVLCSKVVHIASIYNPARHI
jgi:hypothetical protein